jgi:putative ABC transport system substrate-binding protein
MRVFLITTVHPGADSVTRWLLPPFLFLLVGLCWSFAVSAEDATQKVVRMAFVFPGTGKAGMRSEVFWERLRAFGWEEGRNLEVERRYTHGRTEALQGFMEEMVQHKVNIIVTTSTPGALAAKKATDTIPIVVHYMGDPVGAGLVSSLDHPGGNITGMSSQIGEGLPGKWVELLHETIPKVSSIAVLSYSENPRWRVVESQIAAAALSKNVKAAIIRVHDESEIDTALQRARNRAKAIIVLPDALFIKHHGRVAGTLARLRLPAIYGFPVLVLAGGLMSYGPDPAEAWGQAAVYVDKILRGAKAGELPVVQPARFSLAVNLNTAKALGIKIPESILLRADEVIR